MKSGRKPPQEAQPQRARVSIVAPQGEDESDLDYNKRRYEEYMYLVHGTATSEQRANSKSKGKQAATAEDENPPDTYGNEESGYSEEEIRLPTELGTLQIKEQECQKAVGNSIVKFRPTSSNMGASNPTEKEITLLSPKRQTVQAVVRYDIGAEENWISSEMVERLGVADRVTHDKDRRPLIVFNGNSFKSEGILDVTWVRKRYLTQKVRCRRVTGAPFEILFGLDLLLEEGLVTIHDDDIEDENPGKSTLLLVKDSSRGDPEAAAAAQHAANVDSGRLEQHRKWMQSMRDQGWIWDIEAQNFFKRDKDKKSIWLPKAV